MGSKILLVSDTVIDPERFLDVIERMGGLRRPTEWYNGQLSRGQAHVSVLVDPDLVPDVDVEQWVRYDEKLGATARSLVALELAGPSEALAMEVVEAASEHWHLIVDDDHGRLFTIDELRAYPPSKLPFKGR
ncbi:hypothetical protein Acsp03_63990 [Actinomadura sp. NBRC 104412]|uniref:hypothetical protein n=1 Tax=Actinomadura sp. NBRC 104412 TaxID=3032203 RepID=UPI0024A08DDC|nr:hypothetical protein [Actinomadura sp. NBRC 104412]GLZ08933.1 hypothetical protein Acsp03_63990 [Actinomadura sp. NBRC 104412]